MRDLLGSLLLSLAVKMLRPDTLRRVLAKVNREDDAQHAVAHIVCPECGEAIPLTLAPPIVEDGNLTVDFQMDDVWAHAWTHEGGGAL